MTFLLGSGVVLGVVALATFPAQAGSDVVPGELLRAQKFVVDQPFERGWLLVVQHDLTVRPAEVTEPVLFVGAEPAEQIGFESKTGRVAAVVPRAAELDGAPIYFGESEAGAVHADGLPTLTAEQLEGALVRATLRVADEGELRAKAMELIGASTPPK